MSNNRRRRTAKLLAEAKAIERRLERAVVANLDAPLLGRANIAYEYSERTKGTAHGGMGMIATLVESVGLAQEINSSVSLLKLHKPYFESDHVLNIAYNSLCGGQRLQDIELRRGDAVFLDGLGTKSLPDPTTAGDFCRRFDEGSILALQEAINRSRLKVWQRQPDSFFEGPAIIDADASIVPTGAQTKEGMDISYSGIWGYSSLVVSLANTKEPLYLAQHGANRPSHEGVVEYFDRAIALCREAGFKEVRLRGDTDYALTAEFDRFDDDGVRFVFGYDARKNLIETAEDADDAMYHELVKRAEQAIATKARTRPREVQRRHRAPAGLQGAAPKGRKRRRVLLPTGQLQEGLPGGRPAQEPLGRTRRERLVRGIQILLLHHQRADHDRRRGGGPGPPALRPRESHQPAQIRRAGPARAGQHLVGQLGLYGHGRSRLEPQGLVRSLATGEPALARTPRGAASASAHHGVPHLLGRLHRDPRPDRHHRPAGALAHHRLQPVAGDVLPFTRRPLRNAEFAIEHRRTAG